MAGGQHEDDMGAEAEFGVGVLAVDPQEFVVLLRRQGEHLREGSSVVIVSGPSSP
jgi:hypothetical protein